MEPQRATPTVEAAGVEESYRPGDGADVDGAVESVDRDAETAKRLAELRGHILSHRRSSSSGALVTTSVARLQRVIVALLRCLVGARLAIDPAVMLLLFEQEGDVDELELGDMLLEPLGDALRDDRNARRRRLAADRSAVYRRNKTRPAGAPRTSLEEFRGACQGGSVTLDQRDASRSVTLDQRDASRSKRDAQSAPARASTSFGESSALSKTSAPSAVSSLAPTSSLSSPEIQSDPSDYSRARAGAPTREPYRASGDPPDPPDPPESSPSGKRSDRACWILVDHCALEAFAVTKQHPDFAPQSQSKKPPKNYARFRFYDGCARALSASLELLPRADIRERERICRAAYRAHVQQGLPWTRWADHAREFVRLRVAAEARTLEQLRDKLQRADDVEAAQRAEKRPDGAPPPFVGELVAPQLDRHLHALERDASRSPSRSERDAAPDGCNPTWADEPALREVLERRSRGLR